MGTLVRPHLTYEVLCAVPPDGNRYELFDGEVHMSPSPLLRHQRLSKRVLFAMERAIRDASEVFPAPLDVVLRPTA